MINYRLLRNNKETGPYSEEELISNGFKPYDLLWAEGRSAGWQYPSEISAFKKYAPIVEEQPYDRFYKKQPAQKLAAVSEINTTLSYHSQQVKASDSYQPQPQQPAPRPVYQFNVQDLPARHIHVTLPSGNTINLTTLVTKKETSENSRHSTLDNNTVIEKKQAGAEVPLPAPPAKETTPVATSVRVAANDFLTRTITQASVSQPVYQTTNAGFSWSMILGAVIGIATMVGLGIMIGLSISRENSNATFNKALLEKSNQYTVARSMVKPEPNAVIDASSKPENEPIVQHGSPAPKNREPIQHAAVKPPLAPTGAVKEIKIITGTEKAEAAKTTPVQQTQAPVAYIKPSVQNTVAAIEKNLQLSANDFKTGAFGGISGLKYTLHNGSVVALLSVEVEVDYIQANNKIYKTERLLFKDISAGSQSTIDAPASSRGIKVLSHIKKINLRDTALSNITAKS
ncbi:MAG: hypothetical protein ABI813_12515 [Bacteroidota bacterium]